MDQNAKWIITAHYQTSTMFFFHIGQIRKGTFLFEGPPVMIEVEME